MPKTVTIFQWIHYFIMIILYKEIMQIFIPHVDSDQFLHMFYFTTLKEEKF